MLLYPFFFSQCQACETKETLEIGCGNFEERCVCRQPKNCQPLKPTPPDCHQVVKVRSPNLSACDKDDPTKACQPCYHWNFIPMEKNITNMVKFTHNPRFILLMDKSSKSEIIQFTYNKRTGSALLNAIWVSS